MEREREGEGRDRERERRRGREGRVILVANGNNVSFLTSKQPIQLFRYLQQRRQIKLTTNRVQFPYNDMLQEEQTHVRWDLNLWHSAL